MKKQIVPMSVMFFLFLFSCIATYGWWLHATIRINTQIKKIENTAADINTVFYTNKVWISDDFAWSCHRGKDGDLYAPGTRIWYDIELERLIDGGTPIEDAVKLLDGFY